MRSLVGAGLDHASCLGRYDDATAGLSWLRNNGKRRDGAQGGSGNHNFT